MCHNRVVSTLQLASEIFLLSTHSQPDKLANKEYVTLILRLLLTGQGRVVRGEIVDTQGRLRGRFAGWRKLEQTVRAALRAMEDENTENSSL